MNIAKLNYLPSDSCFFHIVPRSGNLSARYSNSPNNLGRFTLSSRPREPSSPRDFFFFTIFARLSRRAERSERFLRATAGNRVSPFQSELEWTHRHNERGQARVNIRTPVKSGIRGFPALVCAAIGVGKSENEVLIAVIREVTASDGDRGRCNEVAAVRAKSEMGQQPACLPASSPASSPACSPACSPADGLATSLKCIASKRAERHSRSLDSIHTHTHTHICT